jgi:hypothetical protein
VRRLVLVACVAKKASAPCTARNLYQSPWFQKARRYAEGHGDYWRILSAGHGLVHPYQELSPYDVRMSDLSAEERREWAASVLDDLLWDARLNLKRGDRVAILAGVQYRQYLEPALKRRGMKVTVPMKGLGIGEQLRWLNQHTRRT